MALRVASSRRRDHDGIQRVDGTQRRADGHDGTDEVADEIQDGVQLFESIFDDIALVLHVEMQRRIGPHGIAKHIEVRRQTAASPPPMNRCCGRMRT